MEISPSRSTSRFTKSHPLADSRKDHVHEALRSAKRPKSAREPAEIKCKS